MITLRPASPAIRLAAARRAARRGFSLIELLIVIAILLAIGGLVAINLRPTQDQAKEDLVVNQMDRFEDALKLFQLHLDRFPSEEEGISVLWQKSQLENEEDEAKWKGPYLEEPSDEDGWGSEWVYIFPSEERPGYYEIRSNGPDGEPDTDDDLSSLDRFRDADGELGEGFDDFASEDEGTTP